MASLAESVEYLTVETAALARTAVELTRKVDHMASTYVPEDKMEDRLRQEREASHMRRLIVAVGVITLLAVLGAYIWDNRQAQQRTARVNEAGATVILCLYGEMSAHRHFDREYSLKAAETLGFGKVIEELSKEVPQTAFDPNKLASTCQPIADAINSGKYTYGGTGIGRKK